MQTKVEVSVDFVKAAHEAACSEWKSKIETEFPSVFKNTQKIRIGTKIIMDDRNEEYILTYLGDGSATLVNIESGMVWSYQPINFKKYITNDQFAKYIGKDHIGNDIAYSIIPRGKP